MRQAQRGRAQPTAHGKKGRANTYPEPKDKMAYILDKQYDYNYHNALPAIYSWPSHATEALTTSELQFSLKRPPKKGPTAIDTFLLNGAAALRCGGRERESKPNKIRTNLDPYFEAEAAAAYDNLNHFIRSDLFENPRFVIQGELLSKMKSSLAENGFKELTESTKKNLPYPLETTQMTSFWIGFNILRRDNQIVRPDTLSYLRMTNAPATEISTVPEILKISESIRAHLDLDYIVVLKDQNPCSRILVDQAIEERVGVGSLLALVTIAPTQRRQDTSPLCLGVAPCPVILADFLLMVVLRQRHLHEIPTGQLRLKALPETRRHTSSEGLTPLCERPALMKREVRLLSLMEAGQGG
uniref:Uncharacterized protein n=1 Tax=Timema poppense TaxID=170557 RepID=A0A7R9CIZ2_TIMPO|nr:unnamed protein product [Timema poppensis]